MRRTVIPELLDDDAGTPKEIADSLADLRFVNRWFGGIRTTERLVRRALRDVGRRELSLLEVGAGTGDVLLKLQKRFAKESLTLSLTMLDRRETHFGANNGRRVNS